jgi:hydroxypyruvate isomerase
MASVWGQNSKLSFEERCTVLARIGFKGVDLPTAEQAKIMKQYGLTPALMTGAGTTFQDGLIRKELHGKFEEAFHQGIDTCAAVGCPNLIAMPGERRGMPREEAADNAAAILSRVKGYAEQKGVTLCMEITNAKVVADQRTDQVFNRLDWGFDVCRKVNSPRVKIVYDIYHAQISDGDVTRNLRDNFDLICHIHVAGVPSRMEIDGTQELNYRFIANAIADLGYTGFVAHEWRPGPGRDPVKSLEQCYEIMNV